MEEKSTAPPSATSTLPNGNRLWLYALGAVLLLGMVFCAYRIVEINADLGGLKADYAELHSVRYELMNAEAWAAKLGEVLGRKIDRFEFNDQNRAEIKRAIENILDQLIVETERIVRKRNLSEHKLLGIFRQLVTDFLLNFDEVRKKTPELAEVILEELESNRGRARIKGMLRTYLEKLVTESATPVDMASYDSLLARYGCADRQFCTPVLRERMARQENRIEHFAAGALALAFLLFASIVWRGLPLRSTGLSLLVLACTVLLALGIFLPMIEIEAKIETLQFIILGEPVSFSHQILFFQRKSITDVVEILVATGEAKMVLVGGLLTLFSILFPFLKLLATYARVYNFSGWSENAAVRFFALRSGKWSMADVMVVALFMAYLGFEGIIDNQMEHIQSASETLNVLTTNGTGLEAGFFLFLGFVLLSLGLSTLIDKRAGKEIR
uniref:Paraquat-inducible protein A n=1 Tax=Candidatus Kentrum sp. DK TaxID=2126562 RepID=A0A450SHF3_9GAMM|nr:MAG: Paraquat-inducible protein A [Candidatus Kentron sp. DK]